MKSALYYILTAVLTFGATFWYFQSKEKTKTVDTPKESEIDTYAITYLFKLNMMSLIDSPTLASSRKINLESFLIWDKKNAQVTNEYVAISDTCKTKNPPKYCNLTAFASFKCRPCEPCCMKLRFNPVYDDPQRFRLVGLREMNLKSYFKGKELQVPSFDAGNFQIFEFSQNQRFDELSVTVDNAVQRMSLR